jgi:hypothetical protein
MSRAYSSFSSTSRGFSQRIHSGRPNSKFRTLLLWHFMVTAWTCVKTSSQTLVTKRTGCCIMTTHYFTLPFIPGNFWQKKNFGDKKNWLLHTTTHCFTPGNFWQKTINFGGKKNCLLHHDNTLFHTSLYAREFLTKNNIAALLHRSYYSVSPTEDKTERPPFWHNWGRITGGAEHPHRTRLPWSI